MNIFARILLSTLSFLIFLSSVNAEDIRALTISLINKQREINGLTSLSYNYKLQKSAQSHADWMAKIGVMRHLQEKPKSYAHHKFCNYHPVNRMINSGYFNYEDCFKIRFVENGLVADPTNNIDKMQGEIIAAGFKVQNIPLSRQLIIYVFPGWMKSSGHKKEILTSNYEEIGVGVAISSKGSFWCVNFGDPN